MKRSLLRRKSGAAESQAPAQVTNLSSGAPLLEVIREHCAQGGRFSLVAQSGDRAYTVLIDRGGVFNATGSDLTGSDALTAAARLTSGRCTVTEGWPVAQPLYQHGLDTTLQELLGGTIVEKALPAPRGVEAIRQIESGGVSALLGQAPTPAANQPPPQAPPIAVVPVAPPAPMKPTTTPAPLEPIAAPPPMRVDEPPPLAQPITPPLTPTAQPPSPALVADVPPMVELPQLAPRAPKPKSLPLVATTAIDEPEAQPITRTEIYGAGLVPEMRGELGGTEAPEDLAPAEQGGVKRTLTRTLLWLVSVEDADQYTLRQARRLIWIAISEAVRGVIHPFGRVASTRWRQAKADWEASGKVAARQRARRTGHPPRQAPQRSGPLSRRRRSEP